MTATLSPQFVDAREKFAAWYDAKDVETQSLVDCISDRTYFIIDEDEYDEFITDIVDYGITDCVEFDEAFAGEFEGYGENVLTQFAEQFCEDTGILGSLSDIAENCIDYNQVWYYAFQHDFSVVEFRGNTYFFHKHF